MINNPIRPIKLAGSSPTDLGDEYSRKLLELTKLARFEEAEALFKEMRQNNIPRNIFSYNIMLNMYSKKLKTLEFFRILEEMKNQHIQPTMKTHGTILNFFSKTKDVISLKEHWMKMKEDKLKPSVVCYNTMIEGLSRAGMIDQALTLLLEMKENGLKPDLFTYSVLMSFFAKREDADKLRELYQKLEEEKIQPDSYIYNIMISQLCRSQDFEGIENYLNQMRSHKCKPTPVTYCIIIENCIKQNDEKHTLSLFKSFKEDQLKNERVSLLMIDFFVKHEMIEQAVEELTEAMNCRFPASEMEVMFNSVIQYYANQLDLESMLRWFDKKTQYGLPPSIFSYNIVIRGFALAEASDKMMEYFKMMKNQDLKPNLFTFNLLMMGFGKAGKKAELRAVISQMMETEVVPDGKSKFFMMEFLAEEDQLLMESIVTVLKESPEQVHVSLGNRLFANLFALIHLSILKNYAKQGNTKEMEDNWRWLRPKMEPNEATWATLMDCYLRSKQYSTVLSTFHEMMDQNIPLTLIHYRTAIEAAGFSKNQSELVSLVSQLQKTDISPPYLEIAEAHMRAGLITEGIDILREAARERGRWLEPEIRSILLTIDPHGLPSAIETVFWNLKDSLKKRDDSNFAGSLDKLLDMLSVQFPRKRK